MSFLAPRGGLPDLGKRLDYTVMRHGEAASGDGDAAEQHCEKFKKIIEEGGFVSHLWRVKKSRIKQSNLDSFFKKVDKRPLSDEPPTGQSRKLIRNDDSSPSTAI
jgi:hypothetical protein